MDSKSRSIFGLAAVVLGVAVAMGAARLASRLAEGTKSQDAVSLRSAAGAQSSPRTYDIEPAKQGVQTAVEQLVRVAATSINPGAPDAPPNTDALLAELTAVLTVYLDGSLERFDAYLAERALVPPHNWDDEASKRSLWDITTVVLEGARFESKSIGLRKPPAATLGDRVISSELPVVSAVRFKRVPGVVDDPIRLGMTVQEFVANAEMHGAGGEAFDARLGLTFVWIASDERWILYRISIYERPGGIQIPMPVL